MAYSADYSVDVKAPPATVFDYVADVSRHGEWGSADDHMTATAERLAFDAADSNSVFHHEFTFSPSSGGTHVERHVTMTKGPFYFPLVLAIFKSTVQKNYNGAMANLKTKLESGPTS
jgi:hypothetical protein